MPLFLSERENLVGDHEAATALVRDVPNTGVEVVDAGHPVTGEVPEPGKP